MLFDNLVSADFALRVRNMADRLGMNPDHIMAVIGFETIYTFSPSIKNSIGATGLIQFLPSTAKSLGTTTDALSKMGAVQQLDYVEEYFRRQIKSYGKLDTLVNVYLSVFYPAAIKKESTWQFPYPVWSANKVFDIDKNGNITKQEVADTITIVTNKKKAATQPAQTKPIISKTVQTHLIAAGKW